VALATSTACAPRTHATPASSSPPQYARRIVLALDGIDYRDIMDARERGLFPSFHTPSRLISTFPSISDIAWHEILGVQPPRGYQRIYYSNAQQVVVGETLDAIKPIEFEDRMDMAFGAKFHHLGAYLISNTVARREVDVDVRDFFKVTGRSTVYVYNVGPDALQHTRGDLEGYLRHLDARLQELEREYLRRTGTALEIVLLSDHGHNKAPGAKFVAIEKTLKASGFRIADELRSPRDVAFSVDGVTTGFGVFCAPDAIPVVATSLAAMDGVEMVSAQRSDTTFDVLQGALRGRIDVRHSREGDRYRYVPLDGDPLRFAPVMARMTAEGAMDADGFADTDSWRRYTAATEFPIAVVRIVRGHTAVTLNPAPILVSILVTHRIGLGLASVTDRLISLGGTHGSLSIASSLGVLMTNFADTHDDLTATVREQLHGFDDLGDVKYNESGGRLTSDWLLAHDARGPFHALVSAPPSATGATAVELWITPNQLAWSRGTGALYVELRTKATDTKFGKVLATSYLPMRADSAGVAAADAWRVSDNRLHYFLPLARMGLPTLKPRTAYEMRVTLDRRIERGGRTTSSGTRDLATFTIHTNSAGQLWPY
jgi:hypothetical protein